MFATKCLCHGTVPLRMLKKATIFSNEYLEDSHFFHIIIERSLIISFFKIQDFESSCDYFSLLYLCMREYYSIGMN
jgi:hypothetical protein